MYTKIVVRIPTLISEVGKKLESRLKEVYNPSFEEHNSCYCLSTTFPLTAFPVFCSSWNATKHFSVNCQSNREYNYYVQESSTPYRNAYGFGKKSTYLLLSNQKMSNMDASQGGNDLPRFGVQN